MTKRTIVVLCAALSFAFVFCFLSMGYAALTDTLKISGSAEIEVPYGLFITKIEPQNSATRLDVTDISFAQYSTTVDCALSKSSNNQSGYITYEITVFNNTTREYAYRDLYYQTSVNGYHNNLISKSNANNKIGVVTNFPEGKIVPAGEEMTFEVTYTLGSSRSSLPSGTTHKTLINYQFGINVDSEADAVDVVHEKFLDILNTTSTYETLVDVLDNKFDGRQEWTSNYVGNVGSATSDDSMAVNTLFAGQLQLIINGETKKATVLIKHENLDNNTQTGDDYVATNTSNGGVFRGYGCEMTLYLTTDDLSERNGWAPVYVSVFTCDRDENGNIISDWYLIGETYKGTANIVGYNGEEGGTGSFVTDNWIADAATYRVTDDYSYQVASGTTIKTLTQTVDHAMIAEFQQLLTDAKTMIEDTTYAGTGITVVEEAYERAAPFYTLDANGNPVANANVTRAQLCPIVRDLETNLSVAQDKIDEITGNN
ncbi:MAG: hypothetical protein IJW70_09880 [Clostridia bacterium]|nr:hypothetical protein [Clostridia bacterium]